MDIRTNAAEHTYCIIQLSSDDLFSLIQWLIYSLNREKSAKNLKEKKRKKKKDRILLETRAIFVIFDKRKMTKKRQRRMKDNKKKKKKGTD